MQKLLLFAGMCCYMHSFAQSNALPTNGNVGIGTTAPTSKLQVNGSARIDSTLTVKDSIIVSKSGHVKDRFTIDGKTVMKADAAVKQDLKVEGNTTVNGRLKLPQIETGASYKGLLTVDENGVVKSLSWLDVVSAQPSQPNFACPDNNNGYTTPINQFWASKPGKIYIPLICNPDPMVGIGTTNPTAKLQITLADTKLKTTNPFLIENMQHKTLVQFNRYGELYMAPDPGSNSPIITIYDDKDYRVLQLEKSGLLRSREIKVDLDGWSDYVFEPDYYLRPLPEVEQYITQNGHLPDVPSADDMCANGLNVAQTDAMLMQKIEELTLYLIDVQKQVNSQQALIEQQKKLIEAQQEVINQLDGSTK